MSVLEHYSDNECSILLGCVRKDVIDARARALQHLGRLMKSQKSEPGTVPEDSAVRKNPIEVIEWTIVRYFPTPTFTA